MSSWISQGVLLGATGATGSTGATGPTGPAGTAAAQTTTTTSSFTMPAVASTVAIAVVSAAWTKLGQTLCISDGTNIGFWEITTRTSNTALTITNRGYGAGTPASGTMATAATVQLIGAGLATAAGAGAMPRLGAVYLATSAAYTMPAIGSSIAVTLGSVVDIINQPNSGTQAHYITDGANHWMIGTPQSIAGLVVTYTNVASNVANGGAMGAGRVYFGFQAALQDQQQVALGGAATLIGTPGFLNTLQGSTGVVITPAAAGGGNIGFALRAGVEIAWQRYNAIRNPEMSVAQRGVGATAAASTYSIDGWVAHINGTSFAATWSQIAAAIPADTSGNNWYPYTPYAYRVNITTGKGTLAAGDYLFIQQPVEGLIAEPLKSNPTSVSLLVRSSITGSFTVSLRDSAGAFTYLALCTISSANTWTRIAIPNITTFTASGTFPDGTAKCYYLAIGLAAGSTFNTATAGAWTAGQFFTTTGQTNFGATTSNTFDFTLVQHEPNIVCTPYIKRELAAEVALAQRYLYSFPSIAIGVAINAFDTYTTGLITFSPMRAAPTATGTFAVNTGSVGTLSLSSSTLSSANVHNVSGNWTIGANVSFSGLFTAEL